MDEDVIFGICFLLAIFSLPVLFVGGILVLSAAAETRSWQKKKAARLQNSDVSDSLIPKESADHDSDSDLELLDSEDEAEKKDREEAKREEEADWQLTTKEKFWKELGNTWGGRSKKIAERNQQKKEREDRRKLAKDMVKVMRRYERRQAKLERRAIRDGSSSGVNKEGSLPSYRNVMDAKQ